jgi:putative hydrolase of the HAD superfamily
LIFPKYNEIDKKNEFGILGISSSQWEELAKVGYINRASGNITDPLEMIKDIVTSLSIEIEEEKLLQILEVRKERYKKANIFIKKSIMGTIFRLHSLGKKLILVSNADIIDKMYWSENPLSKYFSSSVFSYDVGILKPNKEIYQIALNSVNADINRSVFIGDGGHNELLGAKSLGFQTILTTEIISKTWPDNIQGLSKDADYVINSLSELIE